MAEALRERDVVKFVRETRIISAKSVIGAWNGVIEERRRGHQSQCLRLPRITSVSYDKETIQSILGQQMWRLVYDPGISLLEMQRILSSDRRNQPCHYRGNEWWLSDESYDQSGQKEEPGYYLVKMGANLCNMTWQDQNLALIRMGKMFVRASLRLMISLNISYFLTHKTYLSGRCSHWGPKNDSKEGNICASRIGPEGFALYRWNSRCPSPDLGVCVIRKFDFS